MTTKPQQPAFKLNRTAKLKRHHHLTLILLYNFLRRVPIHLHHIRHRPTTKSRFDRDLLLILKHTKSRLHMRCKRKTLGLIKGLLQRHNLANPRNLQRPHIVITLQRTDAVKRRVQQHHPIRTKDAGHLLSFTGRSIHQPHRLLLHDRIIKRPDHLILR